MGFDFSFEIAQPHMAGLYKRIGAKFENVQSNFEKLLFFIKNDDEWASIEEISYFLATIMHETAFTFKPIKEFRAREGTQVRGIQDRYWKTGYYGRGYVQITWERNYRAFAKLLNIDLIKKPDLALDPTISYNIAAIGMRQGLFTGKKLSDYINSSKTDYVEARRVVNGTDRAETLANYAKRIESVLNVALVRDLGTVEIIDQANALEEKQETFGGTTVDSTPVSIDPPELVKPSGISAWKASLSGILTSLGLTGISLGSMTDSISSHLGVLKEYLPLMAIVAFGGGILFAITYIVCRYWYINQKEQRNAMIALKEMEIRANPAMYNVEIRK